jgi:hypothetical protein
MLSGSEPGPDTNIHFGCYSIETLPHTPALQYTLHLSRDTVIHFTTIVNGKECKARFIFHPFRRDCNITYHEYKIQCSIPSGVSETAAYKRLVIEVAQRIYEVHFSTNAKYTLALLESE